ncbi:hypothetical protein [Paenibacillus polymyxa]|uniref:hypothetical protein n=1 Tax=Paenibacillus polymyxa TaxID=1406 RepID=UPI0021E4C2C8|nr:hypothetical protein [Paenibacillus polymyxa]
MEKTWGKRTNLNEATIQFLSQFFSWHTGQRKKSNQRKHEQPALNPCAVQFRGVSFIIVMGAVLVKKSQKTGKCILCNDPNLNPESTTMGASFCDTCWETMKSGDEDKLGERIVWDE